MNQTQDQTNGMTIRDLIGQLSIQQSQQIESLRREIMNEFTAIRRELDQRNIDYSFRLSELERWRTETIAKDAREQIEQVKRTDDQFAGRDHTWLTISVGLVISILTILLSYLVNHWPK